MIIICACIVMSCTQFSVHAVANYNDSCHGDWMHGHAQCHGIQNTLYIVEISLGENFCQFYHLFSLTNVNFFTPCMLKIA